MSREELIRRINEALDSAEGLEGDLALQRIFARDPVASDLADELARIDRALRTWPRPERGEDAWEALAATIEQHLDDALAPIKDPTSRPILEEDEDRVREAALDGSAAAAQEDEPASRPAPAVSTASGEFSLKLLTKMAGGGADEERGDEVVSDRFSFTDLAPLPPRVASSSPAPFIDPSVPPPKPERAAAKGLMSWVGGALAAAAVISLGIVIGMSLSDGASEPLAMGETAPSPVTQAAPTAEPDDVYRYDRAEGAPALGAAEPTGLAEAEVEAEEAAADPALAMRQEARGGGWSVAATPSAESRSRRAARRPQEESAPTRVSRERSATTASGGAGGSGGAATDTPGAEQRPSTSATGGGGATTIEPQQAEQPAAEEPVPPPDLPATPDRDAVIAAMRAIQPLVSACAEERHGVATVEITVGSSGRVRSALVTGDFAGTPEGSCVARAVRRARFPQFTQPTFEITYPFSL